MKTMKISEFIEKNKDKLIIYTPILSVVFVVAGCLLFPDIFYDNFVWKYFWGPIASDALAETQSFNGVVAADKFTWISEIVYGLMILIAIYWFYRLMKKWNVSYDRNLFFAIIPYIIFGIIARTLEDTEFFSEPLSYWFVTPLIYIQTLLIFIGFFVLGYCLQRHLKNKYFTINNVVLVSGTVFLLPFLYFTAQWILGNQWSISQGVRFDIFLLVTGLVALIVFAVYAFSRFFKDNGKIKIYGDTFNLALIAGHMIDGITTYVSIYDPLSMGLPLYSEKHPASDFLLQIWPPLFPIVKFLLIILVIYVFDILYKEELKDYRHFVNLLKTVIFILGFAPGLRDLLRVVMGV